MDTQGTLRVAVVGAGYFSQFHQDAWQRIDAAKMVAIVDPDKHKAASAGAPVFTDLERMLESVQPDVVDIVTPPGTHLDIIKRSLGFVPKVIICQKPFCGTVADAEHAIKLGQSKQVPLVVHENFRFQPWYRSIKREIENDTCGALHQMTFRLRTGDGQGNSAYLDRQPYFQTMPRLLIHETGVHWIDTFRYLFGEPNLVYADLTRRNPVIKGEDSGHFMLTFPDNLRALFDGNRLLDNGSNNPRLTLGDAMLEGVNGSLRLVPDGSVLLRLFGKKQEKTILPAFEYRGFGGDCVYALQAHVVNAILQGDMSLLENQAHDYLRNIEIERAIYDSSLKGCRVSV